jgi:uncharacterized protein (DUF488 family)
MLNRQKVLIEMLRRAKRPVAKMELVKWAFVLRQEMPTGGGPSFYDFVPYHYGPYSFTLNRELDAIVDQGYVRSTDTTWELVAAVENCDLAGPVDRDVMRVVGRFVSETLHNLLEYVYQTYPAFTVNSQRKRLAQRTVAEPGVYTAGYEGLQVDGFLNLLVTAGIRRLIDVRSNPVARRFGFHRSTLSRLCGLLDIGYEHVPQLGIASAERQGLESPSDYRQLFRRYEQHILPQQWTAVELVSRLAVEVPSVLVCMEADPSCCHRSRLSSAVARETGLPVTHLKAG